MKRFNEKKILHISSHRTWRGGEQQVSYLVNELQKYNCLQWILCAEGNAMEAYCEQNGIPHYSYQNVFRKSFKNQRILNDLCERHQIDLIHVHDSHSHTLAFMAALFGNERPIIVSRRVDFPVKDNFFSRKKYNHPAIRRYICVSNKIREVLEKDIEDKSKLRVVYSGIDVSRFQGKVNTHILHKNFGIPSDKLIIGNISAIADHKDHFTFVDTADILVRQGINAVFMIVGEGELDEEIRKYILSKNLEKHIIMTGFQDNIPDILPEFDVFLFTSKTEGLGTSLLDAFACRIPVVTTNAGGIPEIVSHEVNGLMAEVGDAEFLAQQTLRVLNDNHLREKLTENALKTLENFSSEKMAAETYKIYNEVFYNA